VKQRVLLGTLGFAVVVAFCGGLSINQEREVILRYKFLVKELRTYSFIGEMTITMQVMGQEVPTTISFFGEGTLTETHCIEDVDEDDMATIMTISKGQIKTRVIELPIGDETSRQEEIPTIIIRFRVDQLGNIREKRFEKPKESLKSQMPLPLGLDLTAPQMRSMIWEGLLLPKKPVRLGDSWDFTTEQTVNLGDRTVNVREKYRAKLVGFEKVDERDCAVIEITSEIPDPSKFLKSAFPKEKGRVVSVRHKGQSNSKVWFDIANGLVAKSDETTEMMVNIKILTSTGQSLIMLVRGNSKFEQRLTKVVQAENKE